MAQGSVTWLWLWSWSLQWPLPSWQFIQPVG
jgi:hypothetical protein